LSIPSVHKDAVENLLRRYLPQDKGLTPNRRGLKRAGEEIHANNKKQGGNL